MMRMTLSSLAAAAILAAAAGSLMQSTGASAAEKKRKGVNPGLLGWATFPSESNLPRGVTTGKKGKRKSLVSGHKYRLERHVD